MGQYSVSFNLHEKTKPSQHTVLGYLFCTYIFSWRVITETSLTNIQCWTCLQWKHSSQKWTCVNERNWPVLIRLAFFWILNTQRKVGERFCAGKQYGWICVKVRLMFCWILSFIDNVICNVPSISALLHYMYNSKSLLRGHNPNSSGMIIS